jgi:3-deoxy-D-manno-octulosonate 8-phosphate phosphatase KdsC-like HAD superfamily phosphatase
LKIGKTRMKKLQIERCFYGWKTNVCFGPLKKNKSLYSQVAYVGDDVNDLATFVVEAALKNA